MISKQNNVINDLLPHDVLSGNLDCNLDFYLDRDPEDVPVYMGHSSFKTTKGVTLLFIVQSL